MDSKKIAFLFAGQGSQYLGMGKDLYENIKECRDLFEKSDKILDMDLLETMFNGEEEELKNTAIAQPAILVTSLAVLKALEINGIEADFAAGLSLGEYGALIYGNAFSLEEGLLLVKERGRIMGNAIPEGTSKMAAILKLKDEKLDELVKRASEFGILECANYNCPGQVVVGGENRAVDEALKIAKELGGLAIPLKVSGAFHTSLLKEASEDFRKELDKVEIKSLSKTVYSNVKGDSYKKDDNIKELLQKHIMTSVLFQNSIQDMINKGVDTFIEIGPGKVLSGFVKKIDRKVKTYNVEDMKTLKVCIESLKGGN